MKNIFQIAQLRIIIQLIFFVLIITLLPSIFHNYLIEYLPSVFTAPQLLHIINATSLMALIAKTRWLEFNVYTLIGIGIIIGTFFFGRFYCFYYCPVGFIQDLINRVSKRRISSKYPRLPYAYLRYLRPLIFFTVMGLIFVRSPLYQYVDYYALLGKMLSLSVVGIIFFLLLSVLAPFYPRWFCNYFCPTGALLSYIQMGRSRRSRHGHKGQCHCEQEHGRLRRSLLKKTLWGGAQILGWTIVGGSVAKMLRASSTTHEIPGIPDKNFILPPGANAREHFYARCIACGACVRACPSKVIVLNEFTDKFPRMDYTYSFCSYECKRCIEVCPNGALSDHPLFIKKRIRIGLASFNPERCIVRTKKEDCGACAEHCPTGAVVTIPYGEKLELLHPQFTAEKCIGCGGCEYICPARPQRAFNVAAVETQSFAAEPLRNSKWSKPLPKNGDGVNNGNNNGNNIGFPF
ncbi:MAG: 4Fe-4S binding protein [Oligoflexia bacterium]|nr:4Fe-4S binding protein [Oligoflexia bacterium]